MDFPDLGAAVDMPKRDKMPRAPPRKGGGGGGGGGGGEVRPKSALQAMLDTKNGPAGGSAPGAARAERVDAPAEALQAHGIADIGPPPKTVAEPDAAAHKEAIAAIQARIDEGEKRVVCLLVAECGWAGWHDACGRTRPARRRPPGTSRKRVSVWRRRR